MHAATNNAPPSTKSEDLFIVGEIESVEYNGIDAVIMLEDHGYSALLLGKDEKYATMNDKWFGRGPISTSTPEEKTTDEKSHPWEIDFPSGSAHDAQEARKAEEKEDKTTDKDSNPWEIDFPSGMEPDKQEAIQRKEEIVVNMREEMNEDKKTEEEVSRKSMFGHMTSCIMSTIVH